MNAVFLESLLTYVHVGWEPECRSTRVHVCLATFQMKPNRELDAGNWMVQAEISVPQVLAYELHQLMPGDPTNLMSQAEIHSLETNFPSWRAKRPPKGKTAPIKSAYEISIKSGASRLL